MYAIAPYFTTKGCGRVWGCHVESRWAKGHKGPSAPPPCVPRLTGFDLCLHLLLRSGQYFVDALESQYGRGLGSAACCFIALLAVNLISSRSPSSTIAGRCCH